MTRRLLDEAHDTIRTLTEQLQLDEDLIDELRITCARQARQIDALRLDLEAHRIAVRSLGGGRR